MPRIVIFTQDTMASTVATRRIILRHPDQIVAIVRASQLRGDSLSAQIRLALKMIAKSSWSFAFYKFIESSGYSILLLIHKLIRSNRYLDGTALSIADIAKQRGIKLIETGDLSDATFLETIVALKPDFIFCIVGQILKRNVFEVLGDKLLNAHGSYLPEYRGAAQYFWYLLDGHARIGVTLHHMNAGLDTGDVIMQKRVSYDRSLSAYGVHHILGMEFGNMFNEFLERLEDGTMPPALAQDDTRATSTRMPTSADIRRFRAAGHRLCTITDFLAGT